MRLRNGVAFWTYDPSAEAYYFRLWPRAFPPYKKQLKVMAILDISEDGALAGVELVEGKLPPPPPRFAKY